jgi:replication-associated recombination protein RarA
MLDLDKRASDAVSQTAQHANVCLIGPPGTGKTLLAIALGIRACLFDARLRRRSGELAPEASGSAVETAAEAAGRGDWPVSLNGGHARAS